MTATYAPTTAGPTYTPAGRPTGTITHPPSNKNPLTIRSLERTFIVGLPMLFSSYRKERANALCADNAHTGAYGFYRRARFSDTAGSMTSTPGSATVLFYRRGAP